MKQLLLMNFKANLFLAGFVLLGFTSACTQPNLSVDLSLKVQPSGRPGVYLVEGTTNLPDQSRIVVTGVRYLPPSNNSTMSRREDSSFAILDRKLAEVNQGRWTATLSLWQMTTNGQYQEAWQHRSSNFGLPLQASRQVLFTATFEPENQPASVSQQVTPKNLESPFIRFTEDGQPYLQVSEALSVSLPPAKMTSSTDTSLD